MKSFSSTHFITFYLALSLIFQKYFCINRPKKLLYFNCLLMNLSVLVHFFLAFDSLFSDFVSSDFDNLFDFRPGVRRMFLVTLTAKSKFCLSSSFSYLCTKSCIIPEMIKYSYPLAILFTSTLY